MNNKRTKILLINCLRIYHHHHIFVVNLLFLCIALLLISDVSCGPLGTSNYRATHMRHKNKEKSLLSKLFTWPNTYYDKPKHRYPYYDENGTGRLLYGYGGSTLYRYSVFRPLEGYFKK